jgi:diguanylate cyclase (GGDEF)-like protein
MGVAPQPPRLVLRFALLTAFSLSAAAAVILLFVRQHATEQAESAVTFHSRFVAQAILRDQLRPRDFRGPVTEERRVQLDRLFKREVLVGATLRVRLVGPDGRVTYSSSPNLIGKKLPKPGSFDAAFGGKSSSQVSSLMEEGEEKPTRVLDAYVPVTLGSGSAPAGVFSLSQDYAPISRAARDAFLPVAGVFELVLIALYASLFPIMSRVSRRLHRQMLEIEHQALHDDLTGLPNRAFFRQSAEQAFIEARELGSGVAVLLIDLDRFKEINDTLGHESGDLLLAELGGRLQEILRGTDTVARLGGDEFAVLAPGQHDALSAMIVADRIRRGLDDPFFVAGLTLEVEASIGIALFPDHGDDVETIMRHADVAMYVSKEAHAPRVYTPEQDHYSPDRLALVGELRRALEHKELVLHYQPQLALPSGDLHSVEALVRWQHPDHGLLAPDRFLPLAEHTGLIRPLTRYIIDAALRQARAWRDEGRDLGVAVNLSARDLLDVNLPDEVRGLLSKWRIDAHRLELEVTESTLLTDPARAGLVLDRLSALGVTIAIDDFGTGYSSLNYLKRLPVDVLKIDRSFVQNLAASEHDSVIVRSTIDLGHNLGLRVVAEGVESQEIWDHLAALGCDIAQGYHISRPIDAAAVSEWLSTRPKPTTSETTEVADVVPLRTRRQTAS